jgi:translation initiation factor IF-1
MAKEELLELDGIVDEVLPDSRYRVTLELSVYDLTKGRINFRHKDERASGGGGARNTQFRRR